MSNKLDEILYDALQENDTPSDLLNQEILSKANMEEQTMKSTKKSLVAAAVAASILLTGGGTAIAAYRYLSAKSTAEFLGNSELAAYFDETEIVSTCEDSDYRFMYLGNANAKLKELCLSNEDTASTYVALAIERIDGKPMTEEDKFVASPLIQGLNPLEYNIYTMNGDAIWREKDGVLYMILRVDSIEMFADRTVYLAITTGADYGIAYDYDKTTGKISVNSDFEGINELFEIGFDPQKADKEKQEVYLKQFEESKKDKKANGDEKSDDLFFEVEDELAKKFVTLPFETMDTETIKMISKIGKCVDSSEYKADEESYYKIKFTYENCVVSANYPMNMFSVNQPTLLLGAIGSNDCVVLEYSLRDSNDVLHIDFLSYNKEQMEKVLQELNK